MSLRILEVNKAYYPHTGGIETLVKQYSEELGNISNVEVKTLVCRDGRGGTLFGRYIRYRKPVAGHLTVPCGGFLFCGERKRHPLCGMSFRFRGALFLFVYFLFALCVFLRFYRHKRRMSLGAYALRRLRLYSERGLTILRQSSMPLSSAMTSTSAVAILVATGMFWMSHMRSSS